MIKLHFCMLPLSADGSSGTTERGQICATNFKWTPIKDVRKYYSHRSFLNMRVKSKTSSGCYNEVIKHNITSISLQLTPVEVWKCFLFFFFVLFFIDPTASLLDASWDRRHSISCFQACMSLWFLSHLQTANTAKPTFQIKLLLLYFCLRNFLSYSKHAQVDLQDDDVVLTGWLAFMKMHSDDKIQVLRCICEVGAARRSSPESQCFSPRTPSTSLLQTPHTSNIWYVFCE